MEVSVTPVDAALPRTSAAEPLCFEKALLLVYRLFDVANEIHLDRAQDLLAGAATPLKLSRERSKYLQIPRAPLTVHLGNREIAGASGKRYSADVHARLFNFGVVSIRYELKLPDQADHDRITALVLEFEESRELEAASRSEAARLCERVASAVEKLGTWEGFETYTILMASRMTGATSATRTGLDERMAKILLVEEPGEDLSEEEIKDATKHRFSYSRKDLCVIDWNGAVAVDPEGSRDIPDILEFANAQLLEFRFYDDLYDRELQNLYDVLATPRGPWVWWFSGRYRNLILKVNRRQIELFEFVERVENSLKVISDSYLARVYQGALDSFRIPTRTTNLNSKQDLNGKIAQLLYNESQVYTGHFFEIIIILLILYEIVATFF
ncbi:MAG: hypothetical protein HY717_02515 [Planctomycetes bacterium]|nr:hypothetical protein [Planctomycetota bacterium]